jgi:hypothetical protein
MVLRRPLAVCANRQGCSDSLPTHSSDVSCVREDLHVHAARRSAYVGMRSATIRVQVYSTWMPVVTVYGT